MNAATARKKRILVYRTGHLGDTICAIPAFRLIRRFFPEADLRLLCDQPQGAKVAAADVIGNLGIFDRIHTYTSNRHIGTAWQLVREVGEIHPDIAIILPQVSESAENVRRKVKFFRRCGVADVRGHNFPALKHSWQPTESDRLIQILHGIGVRGKKPGYDIPVDAASHESVISLLREAGVDPEKPFLLFCGGGKDATQRWPLDRYAHVLPGLARETNWPVVGLGSPQEVECYRRNIQPHYPELRLLSRSLNLRELFAICRFAAAFFGNDCGPMHAAAAVGCPVAVVMSARALPGAWHPNVTPSLVIRLRMECEACLLRDCVEKKNQCMLDITVERVLSEVPPFLKSLPAR